MQKHIFSVTRMEGKSDLLDLTNSIDEDEEPVDSNTDTDTDEQEKTSLQSSSIFSLPEQEPDIPGIVIPEDIIDIPKMSPKVKLRKKPTIFQCRFRPE